MLEGYSLITEFFQRLCPQNVEHRALSLEAEVAILEAVPDIVYVDVHGMYFGREASIELRCAQQFLEKVLSFFNSITARQDLNQLFLHEFLGNDLFLVFLVDKL
jgi:hypothetical protein